MFRGLSQRRAPGLVEGGESRPLHTWGHTTSQSDCSRYHHVAFRNGTGGRNGRELGAGEEPLPISGRRSTTPSLSSQTPARSARVQSRMRIRTCRLLVRVLLPWSGASFARADVRGPDLGWHVHRVPSAKILVERGGAGEREKVGRDKGCRRRPRGGYGEATRSAPFYFSRAAPAWRRFTLPRALSHHSPPFPCFSLPLDNNDHGPSIMPNSHRSQVAGHRGMHRCSLLDGRRSVIHLCPAAASATAARHRRAAGARLELLPRLCTYKLSAKPVCAYTPSTKRCSASPWPLPWLHGRTMQAGLVTFTVQDFVCTHADSPEDPPPPPWKCCYAAHQRWPVSALPVANLVSPGR